MNIKIFPKPNSISIGKEVFKNTGRCALSYSEKEEEILKETLSLLVKRWSGFFDEKGSYSVKAVYTANLGEQEYELRIKKEGAEILFYDVLGLHYGIMTLKQVWEQCGESVTEMTVKDYPDVKARGVLVDVSRDKIPTLKTLFHIVDILSDLRFNQIQLYNQGYVYEFEDYKYMYTNETPYTKADIGKIHAYCKERFLDFVPNMNCFGHLDMWLKQPQLNRLSECPEGYSFKNMYQRGPGTIDPYDDDAFRFITDLVDEFDDNFTSGMFNANMDEPFELGLGKSKPVADEKGVENVYLDYTNKMNSYIRSKGKTMQMWGDVIFNHPHIIENVPKDVILLDWIYEGDANFEEHGKLMQKHGFSYYLCPGSSSWCTFAGRSDNMRKNIKNAVDTVMKYDGSGVLLTDWGDLGHWQYLPVSYAAYSFGGAYTWRLNTEKEAVHNYINTKIYNTEAPFSEAVYELGNYYKEEKVSVFNTTVSFAVMAEKYIFNSYEEYLNKMEIMKQLTIGIAHENKIPFSGFEDDFDLNRVLNYVDEVQKQLEPMEINCENSEQIMDEYKNSIRMIKHGAKLYHIMSRVYPSDEAQAKEQLRQMAVDIDGIIKEHYRLWMLRNRSGGFSRSSAQLFHLYRFYNKN